MNFKDFYKYRLEHKEWMRMNGLNEGAPEKNGEFTAFKTLKNTVTFSSTLARIMEFLLINGMILDRKLKASPPML